MALLVVAHLQHDRAAAAIVGWQLVEMTIEVMLDLRFRLREEAHAPAVAEQS